MAESGTIERAFALDGDKMKYRLDWKPRNGGNGFGLSDDGTMYTLTVRDRHMVGIVFCDGDDGEEGVPCA